MKRGIALFLARLFSNKYQGLFLTRLGVSLFLAKYGIVGRLGDFLGFFLRSFVGILVESGVYHLDLTLDSYREGKKLEEFKEAASKAYEKATKKVYDENEKEKIRQEYLKIIAAIGNVGNPK